MNDLVLRNALLADGRRADIGVKDGLIAAIGGAVSGADSINLAGDLLLPGFVDGHMHLDKTVLGENWLPHQAQPNRMSRIETDRKIWPTLKLSVAERAAALIRLCIGHGTSQIRTHVDVDTDNRLMQIEGVLAAREKFRDLVDIQIIAFPQSGVTRRPGTLDLLDAAIAAGADLIGGIDPIEIDEDPAGQLDGLFKIAEKRGVGMDIHLHEPGEMGLASLRMICKRTLAHSMQGKVTVSHGFCLGDLPAERTDATIELMGKAGVALVTHGAAGWSLPPILRLRQAGVTVFAGNDDVRDTWSPYGTGDMLERASVIGWKADFRHDELLRLLFDMVGAEGAKVLGIGKLAIEIGAPADFCTVQASGMPEAVACHPTRRLVFKRGRVVGRDGEYAGNA
jgi:cytosine/adenosine deaminase-related metal-dependent hydrolase